MTLKMCFIDTETSGTDYKKNALLQLSGIIEIEGQVKEEFNFYIKPFPFDEIIDESLTINNFTKEMIYNPPFMEPKKIQKEFTLILEKYVNRYDKYDKLFLCGYNSHSFDSPFLRYFFEKCGDNFFGSYFWHPGIDMMLVFARLLINKREQFENFKLPTIAKYCGLNVDPNNMHDAMYDVKLTRDLWLFHNQM